MVVNVAPLLRTTPTAKTSWLSGMPSFYYAAHDETEQWAHRYIVERRAKGKTVIEPCPGPCDIAGATWLCVVADDRPGLLALVMAAIASCFLDTVNARIYTRRRSDGTAEAVDLFAVRAAKPSTETKVSSRTVARIQETLDGLLAGTLSVDELRSYANEPSRAPVGVSANVWFETQADGDVLVVETVDRRELLLSICQSLLRICVNVRHSQVATHGRLAHDEFELTEFDGGALSKERRELIVHSLKEALVGTNH